VLVSEEKTFDSYTVCIARSVGRPVASEQTPKTVLLHQSHYLLSVHLRASDRMIAHSIDRYSDSLGEGRNSGAMDILPLLIL